MVGVRTSNLLLNFTSNIVKLYNFRVYCFECRISFVTMLLHLHHRGCRRRRRLRCRRRRRCCHFVCYTQSLYHIFCLLLSHMTVCICYFKQFTVRHIFTLCVSFHSLLLSTFYILHSLMILIENFQRFM